MRKWSALLLVLVVAGVAAWFLIRRPPPRWTSSSPAALAEFEQGLQAELKFYSEDAIAHYQKALELDPDMAMAHLHLLTDMPKAKPEMAQQVEALRRLRTLQDSRLTEREKLLIDYRLQRADKENARAEKTLAAYLEKHPDDSWALAIRCGQAWQRHDWKAAEACNRGLIKADPNWVQAQNQLGYIAMAEGRFAEAEQLFRTYLYIAPDQANPHDSMGELLTLLGRYDDGEKQLEDAIRIRPTFCAAWEHLMLLHDLGGNNAKAHAVLDRLEHAGTCGKDFVERQRCRVETWDGVLSDDAKAAWDAAARLGCAGKGGAVSILAYHAALQSGHRQEAASIEADMHEHARLYGDDDPALVAIALHLEGARLAADGDDKGAVERFKGADSRLEYWSDTLGLFKLFNRLDLARSLKKSGDAKGADDVLAEVRAINADFASRFAERHALEP
ncbi:MAG: hypothetical protein ABI609_07655 [Acidobacteriota bacterium]